MWAPMYAAKVAGPRPSAAEPYANAAKTNHHRPAPRGRVPAPSDPGRHARGDRRQPDHRRGLRQSGRGLPDARRPSRRGSDQPDRLRPRLGPLCLPRRPEGPGPPATERELRVLKTYLEASLLDDDAPSAPGTGLAAVRQDHLELQRRRRAAEAQMGSSTPGANVEAARPARHRPSPPRPGDPDRSQELSSRTGWSWTRLFRRYDDYELALVRLEDQQREAKPMTDPRKPARSQREGALTR